MQTANDNLHMHYSVPLLSNAVHSHFTLIEALLSCLMLVTIATIVSSVFFTALAANDYSEDQMAVDGALRSQMDYLLGNNLAELSSGTGTMTGSAAAIPLTWTVAPVDLDGDGIVETDAWQVTVAETTGNRSLTMLIVDTQGRIGKL